MALRVDCLHGLLVTCVREQASNKKTLNPNDRCTTLSRFGPLEAQTRGEVGDSIVPVQSDDIL
jgi:hypothetical protein